MGGGGGGGGGYVYCDFLDIQLPVSKPLCIQTEQPTVNDRQLTDNVFPAYFSL